MKKVRANLLVNGHKAQYNKQIAEAEKNRREMNEERQNLRVSLFNTTENLSSVSQELQEVSNELVGAKEERDAKQKSLEELRKKTVFLEAFKKNKMEQLKEIQEKLHKVKQAATQLSVERKTKENVKYLSVAAEKGSSLETNAQKAVREQFELIFEKLEENRKSKEAQLFGQVDLDTPMRSKNVQTLSKGSQGMKNKVRELSPKQFLLSIVSFTIQATQQLRNSSVEQTAREGREEVFENVDKLLHSHRKMQCELFVEAESALNKSHSLKQQTKQLNSTRNDFSNRQDIM